MQDEMYIISSGGSVDKNGEWRRELRGNFHSIELLHQHEVDDAIMEAEMRNEWGVYGNEYTSTKWEDSSEEGGWEDWDERKRPSGAGPRSKPWDEEEEEEEVREIEEYYKMEDVM